MELNEQVLEQILDRQRVQFESKLEDGLEQMRRHVEQSAEQTRAYARQLAEETRRHSGVLFEGLHTELRAVAEGVISVHEQIEALVNMSPTTRAVSRPCA